MIILWTILSLFIIATILNIPMARKPLSEDDGNWFYPAIFRYKGVKIQKNYFRIYGYFCPQWFASIIYNLRKTRNLSFFYYFKIIWYSLTAISIYWLTYCFWRNITLSFISGMFFTFTTAIPNTLFFLTYGEHFFILPINLCIISTYYGITSGNCIFFLFAGLLAAWAFQTKPTTLLFCCVLPVSFLLHTKFFLITSIYFTSFFALTFLPLLMIKKEKGNEHKRYLRGLFGQIFVFINIILANLHFNFINSIFVRLLNLREYPDHAFAYIRSHHDKSFKSQLENFKKFMLPSIKDMYVILLLAAIQVPYLFKNFDLLTFSIILLFIIFFSMQQAQKNYYTPHFNPCWAPVSILAAKTICDFFPYLINKGIFGWIIIALVGFGLTRIVRIIIKSFPKSERNSFGHLDPLFGKVFRLCESVGEFIQQNSTENEKLFVWGDQPSIYLYAKRESFNVDYLLLYAHNQRIVREKDLLHTLRQKPPELLIFYNYKVLDDWNINKLQETIGIPYNLMRSFQITDDKRKNDKNPHGICFDFPLYRRDDEKYKEILLDRALIAEMNKDVNETRRQLENILEISPEDYEASIRLSLLKQNIVESKTVQSYLERKLAENHDSNKNAILLRLLAEIDIDAGNLDSAVKNYEKALDSNPNDFRIHNGLGELSFSIDKTETALKSFKKAIELHPYSSDVLNNIGVLLLQSGKRDDAIKYFQKALSFMPSHPDARKNMEALT